MRLKLWWFQAWIDFFDYGNMKKNQGGARLMWIKGFIHQTEDEAFLGNVHIVSDLRFRAGEMVGWMELSNSDEVVMVKRHPSGCLHGQIMKESEAFGE